MLVTGKEQTDMAGSALMSPTASSADEQKQRRRLAIDKELQHARNKLPTLNNLRIISCVENLVRVQLSKTPAKTFDVCLQFPVDFPDEMILLELKSKTLPSKFLECVDAVVSGARAKIMQSDSGQVVETIRVVQEYFDANPLCVCVQEVMDMKRLADFGADSPNYVKNELLVNVKGQKHDVEGSLIPFSPPDVTSFVHCDIGDKAERISAIRQSKCQLQLHITNGVYLLNAKITVADDYPESAVETEIIDCNFPPLFCIFFRAQAAETARQCVEAPVMKPKKNAKNGHNNVRPFEKRPSLLPVASFLIQAVHRYPQESCAICDQACFPATPDPEWTYSTSIAEHARDPTAFWAKTILERVYCAHLFHTRCLDEHMKVPPFPRKCPKCTQVIYHERWRASDKTREERWAHEQAKQRELADVADFMA